MEKEVEPDHKNVLNKKNWKNNCFFCATTFSLVHYALVFLSISLRNSECYYLECDPWFIIG